MDRNVTATIRKTAVMIKKQKLTHWAVGFYYLLNESGRGNKKKEINKMMK